MAELSDEQLEALVAQHKREPLSLAPTTVSDAMAMRPVYVMPATLAHLAHELLLRRRAMRAMAEALPRAYVELRRDLPPNASAVAHAAFNGPVAAMQDGHDSLALEGYKP